MQRYPFILLTFLAALLACGAWAQTVDGNLVGTITDATGAVVTGADLELVNDATNVKYTSRTTDSGQYRFNNIPIGIYSLTAKKSGFATRTVKNVQVVLNRTATTDVTLAVATAAATVDVVESTATVEATTAAITNVFESKATLNLPQASNGALGVLNLALLGAGVASSGGVGYGTGPSVGGQRPTNNSFNIEGTDNNDKSVTGRIVDVSNEAVGSFSLLQNQFSAEFGHSSGGVFNTAVKSGTNDFHGSMYIYHQNRNYNALDAAFKRGGISERQRYDNNRMGATAGGAIVKNRIFYFGNFEYNPQGQQGATSSEILAPTSEGLSRLASIPGVSQTNLGVFRQYVNPAGSATQTIRVGGVPIPVGVLPIARPSWLNNYNWLASVDFNATDKDNIRFRYVSNTQKAIDTAATLPVFFGSTPYTSHLASLTYNRVIRPNLTNELRLGYSRSNLNVPVPDIKFPGLDAFPNLTFDELGGLNIGPNPNGPQSGIQNTYQVVNNMSWIKGAHTIKFGYDGRKVIAPSFFVQRFRGDYYYSDLERYLLDKTPDILAERSAGGFPFAGDLSSHYAFFNDEWRLFRGFTLNLGVRYEWVDVPYGSKLQRLNSIASVPGVIEFNEPTSQKNNWAPRIGFAYSPFKSGNTVIRGGFGMSYDQVYQNLGINSLPPQFFSTNNAAPDAADRPGFLAGGGLPGSLGTSLTPAEARSITSSYVPPQQRPYSLSWNFGIQQTFMKDYTFETRYVGTRGVKLPVQTRLNALARVTSAENGLPTFLQRPSQADLDRLTLTLPQIQARPFFVPAYENAGFESFVTAFMPWGNSVYHGLQTQLTKRFAQGFSTQVAYTWSKNIDDSTAALFSTLISPRRPQDFQNWQPERSRSALDRTHRFTVTGLWEVPWFKASDNWFAKNVAGNWTFGGTYTKESAMYGTVQSGIDSNLNFDGAPDRAIINPAGTDGVGSGVTALTNSRNQVVGYLANNPNARYIVAGSGVFANGGRNTLKLRGINNIDFSAMKNIQLGKGDRAPMFQFRAEMYNAMNHSQFTPGSINTIAAVSRTDTRNYLIPSHPNFNNPETAFGNNPRVIQLVGRIQW